MFSICKVIKKFWEENEIQVVFRRWRGRSVLQYGKLSTKGNQESVEDVKLNECSWLISRKLPRIPIKQRDQMMDDESSKKSSVYRDVFSISLSLLVSDFSKYQNHSLNKHLISRIIVTFVIYFSKTSVQIHYVIGSTEL